MNENTTSTSPTTNQPTTNKFTNPLEVSGEYNPTLHGRVQVDMPKDDLHFFKSILPSKGSMQTIINILLVKLQTQIKHHGLTSFIDADECKRFITECRITDGRSLSEKAGFGTANYKIIGTESGRLNTGINVRSVFPPASIESKPTSSSNITVPIGSTAPRTMSEASSLNDGTGKKKPSRKGKKLKE